MWIISKRVNYENAVVVAIRIDGEDAEAYAKELASKEPNGIVSIVEGTESVFIDCGIVSGREIGYYVTFVSDAK
jgi:hypothetical protein